VTPSLGAVDVAVTHATPADAAAIAALRSAAAQRLTREHGHGHWSRDTAERGVARAIATSRVLVARTGGDLVGTVRLATKKPWAIDAAFFTPVRRPLYLHDMAVDPEHQRRGIGRRLLERARAEASSWPADAMRLDAYDAPAGAGEFYARCGWAERGRVTFRGTPLVYFELVLA
jgi:GNAT superfamily N-acetyltransferase